MSSFELLGAVTQSGGLNLSNTGTTLDSNRKKLMIDFINKNAQRIADMGEARSWTEFRQLVIDASKFVNDLYTQGKNYLTSEKTIKLFDYCAAVQGYLNIMVSLGRGGVDADTISQQANDLLGKSNEIAGWTIAAPTTIATADMVKQINEKVDALIAAGELDDPMILPSQKAQWMRLAFGNGGTPATGWERDFRVQAIRSKYNADGTRKDGRPVNPNTVDAAYATVYREFAKAGLVMPEPKAGAPAEFVTAYNKAAALTAMPSGEGQPGTAPGTVPGTPTGGGYVKAPDAKTSSSNTGVIAAIAAVAVAYLAMKG